MRTPSEEEVIEISNLIQEFGKKLYSKDGKKFLEEAKKFLNKEPCWLEKEQIHHLHGHGKICVIGGPRIEAHAIEL